MNRREMLRVVGVAAIVPFGAKALGEEVSEIGVDGAEQWDWGRIVYANNCCFRAKVILNRKCIFRNCVFEKGLTLEKGSEGTEFLHCTFVGDWTTPCMDLRKHFAV